MARPIYTLYREELRALARGRFAYAGAASALLAIGGLATAGTRDTWLDGYGIIAYGLAPLAFIPLAAGLIASPRASRFVECVFTAPVRRGDWLAAKLLVLATLAAAYYAALLPMMLVYAAHVGVPPLLGKFLLWTPGLLVASLAVGALIGVLFVGDSLAAPTGAGMGALLACAFLIPLQELLVSQGNGATRTGHITLMSPAVLLKNALGFTLVAASVPSKTALTWISLAAAVAGCLGLAAWVFLRAQGVETWEATRRQRWTIGLCLAALALFPVCFANAAYDRPAPQRTNAPANRGFSRAPASLALVAPGAPLPRRCCSAVLNREDWPLPTGQASRRDLLLLLPVDVGQAVTNLQTALTGGNGLSVTAIPGAALDSQSNPIDTGPTDAQGRRPATIRMARIPVSIVPAHPWDIGGDRYPLDVAATYQVAGDAQPRSFRARAAIDAQVPNAIYQMGLAALLLPLLCCVAAIRRRRRTQ